MQRLIIDLLDWIGRFLLIQPFVAPTIGAAVTVMSNFFGGSIPWPYVLAAAAFVFAALARGLVAVDEWRFQTDPSGKLVFSSMLYGFDHLAQPGGPAGISIQVGISLTNLARFPIFFEVERMDSYFEGRVPKKKNWISKPIQISAGGTGYWRDEKIDFEHFDSPKGDGRLSYKIAYWRYPERKFFLDSTREFEATFKENGVTFMDREV